MGLDSKKTTPCVFMHTAQVLNFSIHMHSKYGWEASREYPINQAQRHEEAVIYENANKNIHATKEMVTNLEHSLPELIRNNNKESYETYSARLRECERAIQECVIPDLHSLHTELTRKKAEIQEALRGIRSQFPPPPRL